MKKILFFLLIALAASTALFSQAQNDIRARRVIANEQVLLRNYRVDTITNDTTGIAGAEKTLMTAGAIFDFVNGRTLGGGGGGSGTVTSVGLSMPSAFNVSGSPVTSSGTLSVTGAGTTSQYIRGDGSLATFPSTPTLSQVLTAGNSNGGINATWTGGSLLSFADAGGRTVRINSDSGFLRIFDVQRNFYARLKTNFLTADQHYNFPDASGTIALAGDIKLFGKQDNRDISSRYFSGANSSEFTLDSLQGYFSNVIGEVGGFPHYSITSITPDMGISLRTYANFDERVRDAGLNISTTPGEITLVSTNNEDSSSVIKTEIGKITLQQSQGDYRVELLPEAPNMANKRIMLWDETDDKLYRIAKDSVGASGGSGTVTSVGLSMPSAFNVSGSPVTGAGTLTVTGAGTTSQYIRGDGTLSTFLSDVRNGISLTTTGASGAATYNSSTGVLNIPVYAGATGASGYIQNQYAGSQAADYYVTGRFRRENSTAAYEYVRENMNTTIAGYELEVKEVAFEDRAAKFKMQWTTSENMIVLEAGTASAANNRITVGKDGMKIQPSYSDAAENFFGENSAGFITKRTAAQTRGDISAQAGIQFKDEGSNIGTAGAVTNVNYVGAGVTATHSTGTVTVTIPGGMTNPMTTEGDLIVGGSSGTPTRLAIGTNNYVLKSNGTTASWQPESGGGYTNLTQFVDQTAWRLFYSNGSGDVTELALGSSGTVLTSNGATSAPSFETPSGGVSFGSSGQIPYTNSTTDDFDYSSGLVYSSGNLSVGGNIGTAGNYEMQRSASNDHVRIGYDATNSVWSLSMRKDWESFNRGVIEWGGGVRTTPALFLGYNFEYDASGNHIMTIGGVEKFRVYPVGVSVSGDLVAGFSPTVQGKITSVASSGNQFAAHYSETIYSTWKTTSTGEVEINAAGSSPIFNFLDDVKVPDEAYGSGWNGSLEVPTKNAVYDKIESLSGGTPGGADKEFQFNQGGIFQGSAMLTQETDQVLVTSASDGSTTPLVVNGQEGYTGYLTDFSQSNVNRLRIHSSGYVDIMDISTPGTPASGYGRLYVNSDKLGFKNDAGTAYVVVGEATTQTLTNKRITKRITSEASSATPTINTDNADIHKITALATDITSMTTNLSGSPNEGDDLEIWITGTATRNITWGASFVAGSSTPPTATNGTATLKTVWNRNSSAWVFKGMY